MSEQFDLFADLEPELQEEDTSPEPRVLYFDTETQKSADDVGGWDNIHLMKLAVGVVWDSREGRFLSYQEKDADKLVEKLRSADLIVGFNVLRFDYTVLQPYSSFDLQELKTFDMLLDITKRLGFRLSLNSLAQNTLKIKKSADGLISLQWFKEGKMDKIIEYCIKDVEITRDLFLFGRNNGYVEYESKGKGVQKLQVEWNFDIKKTAASERGLIKKPSS